MTRVSGFSVDAKASVFVTANLRKVNDCLVKHTIPY